MTEAMKALDEIERAIKALLCRDERNTCQHEETRRGGAIWEICSMCGAKWADDEGGKPEWQEPNEWDMAYKALSLLPTLRAALAPPADGEVEAIRVKPKFPPVITAFCTKNGVWSFDTDCGTLFPVGEQHQYVDADCTRQAALLFRNPDNFCALLDAFLASGETEVAGKLDDALKAIARSGREK